VQGRVDTTFVYPVPSRWDTSSKRHPFADSDLLARRMLDFASGILGTDAPWSNGRLAVDHRLPATIKESSR
jgi:hypothetical protein